MRPMKYLYLLAFSSLIFLSSCDSGKINSGEITYQITYPNTEISGFMKAILPETMTIIFNDTRMKSTIARGEIFATDIISDETDESVEMRLDFGDKLFYTVLNENDVKKMIASQPKYDIKDLKETDSLVGLAAQAYEVNNPNDTIERMKSWFTADLAPQKAYWFTSYNQVVGMPLEFDIERYGVMMHLTVTDFEEREIMESEFEREEELKELPFEAFEAEVQELFNILME